MKCKPILERFSKWIAEGSMSTPILRKVSKWLKRWAHVNAYTLEKKTSKGRRGRVHRGSCYCTRETKFILWRVVTLECRRYVTFLGCYEALEPSAKEWSMKCKRYMTSLGWHRTWKPPTGKWYQSETILKRQEIQDQSLVNCWGPFDITWRMC